MRLSKKEYLVLNLLRASQPMYGLALVKASDGALKRGTVYVTLNRMVEKGYLTSEQEKETQYPGLPRRLYSLSGLGQRALMAEDAAQQFLGSEEVGYAV